MFLISCKKEYESFPSYSFDYFLLSIISSEKMYKKYPTGLKWTQKYIVHLSVMLSILLN